MRCIVYLLSLIVLININCTGKEKTESGQDPDTQGVSMEKFHDYPSREINKINEDKPLQINNEKEKKDVEISDEFFKGGIKVVGQNRQGIYITVDGDSVWVIAKKYIRDYKKMPDFNKVDIGNAFYCINKANFRDLFGGVSDIISIKDKIIVPIDEIEALENTKADKIRQMIPGKGEEFFRGGIRVINGKKTGIYIVKPGENVWTIAKKFLIDYAGQENYTKNDSVRAADKILINNFKRTPEKGIIEEDLKVRRKILIPLD